MDNPWDTVAAAVRQAADLDRALRNYSPRMAELLVGRLRHACTDEVVALKKELRDFNINTRKWKQK